jgi:hypothetical protein
MGFNLGSIGKVFSGIGSSIEGDASKAYHNITSAPALVYHDVAGAVSQAGKTASNIGNTVKNDVFGIPKDISHALGGVFGSIFGPLKKYLMYGLIAVIVIIGLVVITKVLGSSKMKKLMMKSQLLNSNGRVRR